MADLKWWIIEQKTHLEIMDIFKSEVLTRPWCQFFLYDSPNYPGNLNSKRRIGFVPFDKCVQNRLYYVDQSRNLEILAAGGITTQIHWDNNPATLPAGWQGSVTQSYYDTQNSDVEQNTMVALLAFTTQRFRNQGLSGLMLSKMIELAKERQYKSLLVPALPPSQFEKDHISLSMEELASLKREDDQYYDYWVRLHTRKGAEVIGYCDDSHRFVYNLKDFSDFVSSTPIHSTGEHIVNLDRDKILGPNSKNMWQVIYADLERNFVTFNWGCIWMKYDIE